VGNVSAKNPTRFWDEAVQKYKHSRSTGILVEGKKEHRYEAVEMAKQL
jgi:hypothetical protein